MLPLPSAATPAGELSLAAVAAPPSPPNVPDPATVEMFPVEASTLRMRLLPESAM